MAVDVSRIPNNNKFDPVREAILQLQTEIEDTGATIGNGTLTISTSSPLTGSGTFTANQTGPTSISIGIDGAEYLTNITHDTVNQKLVVTYGDGTTADLSLAQYIDDTNLARLVSGSLDSQTGIATFTRDDATTFTVDLSALFDDTDTNDFLTSASFDDSNGIITFGVTNQTSVTVDIDGRYPLVGDLTAVSDNIITSADFSATSNRFKLTLTQEDAGTIEASFDDVVLSESMAADYIPYVKVGGGDGDTTNAVLNDSYLKIDGSTLKLDWGDTVGVYTARDIKMRKDGGGFGKYYEATYAADSVSFLHYESSSDIDTAKIGATTTGRIRINDTYSLPVGDGTSGQVLTTDGSGDLSWADASGGGSLDLQDVTDNGAVTTRTIQAGGLKTDLIQSASQASESFIDLDDDLWFAGAVTNVLTLSSKSHMVFVNDTNSNGTTENFSFYTQGTTDANATKLFEIQQGGDVNVVTGSLKVGGTTVIDSSRAASFQTLQVAGNSNLSGTVTIDTGSSSSDALVIRGDSPTINFIDDNTTGSDDFYIHVNSNNFYILRDAAGSDTIGTGWDAPHPLQLEGDTNIGYLFGSRMFADNYHPNADKWTSARTITLGGDLTGSVSIDGSSDVTLSAQVVNNSHTHDDRYYTESESNSRFTSKDHFRSTGTGYYTSTTTSALLTEALGDGAFNSYLTAHKTGWSYAGNGNLTDAGRLTELAGTSWLWWTDDSTDAQQGNVTALCIAPNSGGSANKVFIYNNQGSGYAPGWREVWTSASDGSGSGLDADLLDGQHASAFQPAGSYAPAGGSAGTDWYCDDLFYDQWIRNNGTGDSGLYWHNSSHDGYAWHIYPQTRADMTFRTGSGNGGIKGTVGDATARGYVHWTTSNEIGFLNASRSWSLRVDNSGNTFATGSHRAPIFYDSNDTGYYLNPEGTNRIYELYANDVTSTERQASPRWDTAFYVLQAQHWYGDSSSQTMYIGESGNTVNLRGRLDAAIMYDYNNTDYYANPASTSNFSRLDLQAYSFFNSGLQVKRNIGTTSPSWQDANHTFSLENSDAGYLSINFHRAGYTSNNIYYTGTEIIVDDTYRSTVDMRAPIFYDSNDTYYYVNPASDSRQNNISSNRIGINNSSNSSRYGISLYGGYNTGEPTYGLLFTGTSLGTHGAVTGNWATYFTMNNDNSRGWIFRRVGSGNCASISGGGTASFNGDVIAYYSDMRLKTKLGDIKDPIGKIQALNGFYYEPNEVAESYGYEKETRVGLSAQEVEAVLPEIVTDAPIGDGYKTVDYAKLVPVLVEAIKEQQKQIDELKSLINKS